MKKGGTELTFLQDSNPYSNTPSPKRDEDQLVYDAESSNAVRIEVIKSASNGGPKRRNIGNLLMKKKKANDSNLR
jgi:hypothetical protein